MWWDDFLRASALILIAEAVLPFLSPRRFRRFLFSMAGLEDRWLRLIALASMIVGLTLLQLTVGNFK